MSLEDIVSEIQDNFVSPVEVAILDGEFNIVYNTENFRVELLMSYGPIIVSNLRAIDYGYIVPEKNIGFAVWKLRDFYVALYASGENVRVGVLLLFEDLKDKYEEKIRAAIYAPTTPVSQEGSFPTHTPVSLQEQPVISPEKSLPSLIPPSQVPSVSSSQSFVEGVPQEPKPKSVSQFPQISLPPESSVTPDILAKVLPSPYPPVKTTEDARSLRPSSVAETGESGKIDTKTVVSSDEWKPLLSPTSPSQQKSLLPPPRTVSQSTAKDTPKVLSGKRFSSVELSGPSSFSEVPPSTPSSSGMSSSARAKKPIISTPPASSSVSEILGDLLGETSTEKSSIASGVPRKEVKTTPGGLSISSVARSISTRPARPPSPPPVEEGPKITVVSNPLDLIVSRKEETSSMFMTHSQKQGIEMEEKSKSIIEKFDIILKGGVSFLGGGSKGVKKAYPVAKKDVERASSLGLLDPDSEIIIKFCDGKHTIEEIAREIKRPVEFVRQKIKILERSGVLRIVYK